MYKFFLLLHLLLDNSMSLFAKNPYFYRRVNADRALLMRYSLFYYTGHDEQRTTMCFF